MALANLMFAFAAEDVRVHPDSWEMTRIVGARHVVVPYWFDPIA